MLVRHRRDFRRIKPVLTDFAVLFSYVVSLLLYSLMVYRDMIVTSVLLSLRESKYGLPGLINTSLLLFVPRMSDDLAQYHKTGYALVWAWGTPHWIECSVARIWREHSGFTEVHSRDARTSTFLGVHVSLFTLWNVQIRILTFHAFKGYRI